jgi:hypothetical protein
MHHQTQAEWNGFIISKIRHVFPEMLIKMIKSRRMRWAGNVARREGKRNAYRIFVGKPEGKRPLLTP